MFVVIAKCGNGREELLLDDKITAFVRHGVICKVSNRKTLSGETVCFLENVCNRASSNLLFSYELLIGSGDNQLSWNAIYVIYLYPISQLCLGHRGPGY